MKSNILKIVLTSLLVLGFSSCDNNKDDINKINSERKVKLPKPVWEDRLTNYKNTGIWYQQADEDEKAAYNIANTYSEKIKDFKKAIEWYLYSDSIKTDATNLFNLALNYDENKDYINAIEYYKKAFLLGNLSSANNLAGVFENIKKYKKAEEWYKKAIERENLYAIKNLGLLYHEILKNDIKASAYFLNLIAYKEFKKEETLKYLKERWNLSNKTIKKGYELQLKMEGLPRRYTGELNLD